MEVGTYLTSDASILLACWHTSIAQLTRQSLGLGFETGYGSKFYFWAKIIQLTNDGLAIF